MDDDGLTVADVLDRAADLLTPDGSWTQGWAARTALGDGVPALSEDACCWCAWGALEKVSHGHSYRAFRALAEVTDQSHLDPSLWGEVWNDASGRTQAEVVAKLREAAARARSVQS